MYYKPSFPIQINCVELCTTTPSKFVYGVSESLYDDGHIYKIVRMKDMTPGLKA